MKVSEMIKNLQEFMDENGDLDCWFAENNEGSDYHEVYYSPCLYYTNKKGEVIVSFQDIDFDNEYINDMKQICVVN